MDTKIMRNKIWAKHISLFKICLGGLVTSVSLSKCRGAFNFNV